MIKPPRYSPAIFLLAGAFSLVGPLAFALGGGGNSNNGSNTPVCEQGYVWNASKSECVKATSSTMDDETLFALGRDLALAGRYQEALDALQAVASPDSMVLTMIGYATRKMGNYDEGLSYYGQALNLDPNNANAHEYLGEAYAEKGNLDLAQAELEKVASICGTTCEQYEDLARAIAGQPDES